MDVSVALCTYEGERYLRTQLDSILSQTRVPDEIVVFDDRSTDKTVEILREYESDHPGIFDIHENDKNHGVTKNFERAFRQCSGDLIAVSDQDDVWAGTKLERQIQAYKDSDSCLVCHNSTVKLADRTTTLWETLSPPFRPQSCEPADQIETLIQRNFVQGATMLFDAGLRDSCLPIPESWMYDYWIAIIGAISGGIQVIDNSLLRYRQHDEQKIGAGYQTPIQRVRQSMRTGRQQYEEIAKQWGELSYAVDEFETADMVVDDKHLGELIQQRRDFAESRAAIYDPERRKTERVKHWVRNIQSGGYVDYKSGVKSAVKDMIFVAR